MATRTQTTADGNVRLVVRTAELEWDVELEPSGRIVRGLEGAVVRPQVDIAAVPSRDCDGCGGEGLPRTPAEAEAMIWSA